MSATKTSEPLLALLAALNESSGLDDAGPRILQITGRMLGAEVAEMWLADGESDTVRLRYNWGAPGIDSDQFQTAAENASGPDAIGLIGRAWSSGKAASAPVPDAGFDARAAEARKLNLGHASVVPITPARRGPGVLVYYTRENSPAQQTPPAMAQIRGHISHYIKRALAEAELRRTSDQLGELASTDPLTGLHNRREFDRMLRTTPRRPYTVMSIDVDHLKEVNDDHGHGAGDEMLKAIASTLALLLRGSDVIARVGGDEFAAVLPEMEAPVAARVAERLRTGMHTIKVPFGRPLISVGWACGPAGVDPLTVWKTADECLYTAKREGGDRVIGTQFTGAEVSMISTPSYSDLLGQVMGGQRPIHTVYQPIICIVDGRVIAYEALARPEGFTPTDSVEGLFDAARRAGRLAELDLICRRTALAGAAPLPRDADLFINVSAAALLSRDLDPQEVLRLIDGAGRSPRRTILEISERERIRDLERLMIVLARYRQEGIRIAIDDVGEGHTTFELLAASGAEYLKLGRSLTMTASRSGARAAIMAAVTFAGATGATVIAEGVENEYACDQIRALGIEYGQGFGLGKPTASSVLENTVDTMATRTALRPLRPGNDRPQD